SLERVLASLASPPFTWEVREIGLQVAGLMTADLVERRVAPPVSGNRIMVPGRCRGDLEHLSRHFGVPVERGPDDLKDIPQFFNRTSQPVDLSAYDVKIFAEIVDAPRIDVAQILARAHRLQSDGANVIDL